MYVSKHAMERYVERHPDNKSHLSPEQIQAEIVFMWDNGIPESEMGTLHRRRTSQYHQHGTIVRLSGQWRLTKIGQTIITVYYRDLASGSERLKEKSKRTGKKNKEYKKTFYKQTRYEDRESE